MTGLEIGVLLVGVLFLLMSFFLQDKLTPSDLEEIEKLSKDEIRVLIKRELSSAEKEIHDTINQRIDDSYEELDRKTDKETNDKIKEISEFSDSVLDSMNKSHKEIMFMYDMLNDKQKKVTELTKEVQELESVSRGLIETIDQKKMELQNLQVELDERKVPAMTSSEIIESNTPVEPSLEEEFVKNYAPTSEEGNGSNANQKILELKKQGYSEVEIAKKLGKGLGEVKLVLGLFQSNM